MTTLTLARSQSFEVPTRPSIAVHFSLSVINTALLVFVAALGIWYLVQVNLTMAKNYQIRDMQNQLAAAQTVAQANEITLTEFETVNNLTAEATSLGMVPVGTVEYITQPTSGMAMR
jgi:hypothetical protein